MRSVLGLLLGRDFHSKVHAFSQSLWQAAREAHDPCEIPETRCPPRRVGRIEWTFARGATPTASVLVRNAGSEPRSFEFRATPLAGSGVGSAAVSVTPTSATIEPGGSAIVSLRLEQSGDLVPGQKYRSELQLTGSWQQAVSIESEVLPDVSVSADVEPHGASCPSKAGGDKYASKPAIVWEVERGVTPVAHLRLASPRHERGVFELRITPLVGVNAEAAELALSAARIELEPGGHGVVRLQLSNSAALGPTQRYHAALSIEGGRVPRIPISLIIKPDPHAHVEVSQGDFPTRLRAHHWYDHFQCSLPCGPGSTGSTEAGEHSFSADALSASGCAGCSGH
jgi:hypothetical protein